MFNKFAAPDVKEEKARMRALVESFKKNNDEEDEENEDEEEN